MNRSSMHVNFNALPALIALAILVAVFAAILRQGMKQRVQLWLLGWAFILLDSLVQFVQLQPPQGTNPNLAIGLSALQLGTISFLVSVAPKADSWRRQLLLGTLLAIVTLAYSNAIAWGVSARSFYYAIVALGLISVLSLVWSWHRVLSLYVACLFAFAVVLALLIAWSIGTGNREYGIYIVLAALNLLTSGLYWYRLRRNSAGVITTVFGFVGWGLTFPARILLGAHAPSVHVEAQAWNIPKYLVAVGMIVTLLEDQIRESEHLAYHDALTGLPNRRLLQDRLVQAVAHADRNGSKVAVLLLDLDDFKEVNDTFGHRIGDVALQQVVMRLSHRMRAADTLARSGGDEFTVVSQVSSPEGAQTLVSALQAALIVPFKISGHLVQTGVSIGYALYPDDATDPADLCAAADKAMYASKRITRPPQSQAGG